ncbi:C39 family peptidase [Nostoc sp. DSM 114167]|jgi:hypothetical protein|uniref:C39 family peptidase n=1 Tax=Nostoc sp. DSM 114167 TaxID=3439050 RepID=UPI0040465050
MTRTVSSTANPSRRNNTLPINLIKQEKQRWCWAACILMIVNYLGNSLNQENRGNSLRRVSSQCELIHLLYDRNLINRFFRNIFGPKCCSIDRNGESCNISCSLDDFSYLYGKHNVICQLINSENPDDRTVTFADIRETIDQLRPIQIAYMDDVTNGHVVVIKGYEIFNDKQFVRVNDPSSQKGSGFLNYEALSQYSDNPKLIWKYTWQFRTNSV